MSLTEVKNQFNVANVMSIVCSLLTLCGGIVYVTRKDETLRTLVVDMVWVKTNIERMDRQGTQYSARELKYDVEQIADVKTSVKDIQTGMKEILKLQHDQQVYMSEMRVRSEEARASRVTLDQDIPAIANALGVKPADRPAKKK